MNIRPRCREWLPLSTQQLRLRNLQAIHAVNIELNVQNDNSNSRQPAEILMYYTLHDHPENDAFYQSEKLTLRKHLPLKWEQISCQFLVKSNANCVCIKIWSWTKKAFCEKADGNTGNSVVQGENDVIPGKLTNEIKEPISALTREFLKSQKHTRTTDKLVLTWGVYFSGLIPLSQNSEVKCSTNSLIFQMNDEFFASPEHFSTENLREQMALNYERYSASVPKCSIPTPEELTINSPHVSRSSSPTTLDWQRDLMRMSKTRYTQLNCVRSEVRNSYDLLKLLKLQQLQRQRLQTQRESVELTVEIKHLSLRCITKEQLLRKPRTISIGSSSSTATSSSQYHSMGRTLSLLLAEQERIDPHQMLRAQQLQQQLETLKSKQRLLQSAHCTFSKRINHLEQQLSKVSKHRRILQELLSLRWTKLEKEKNEVDELCQQQRERKHRKCTVVQHLEKRISVMCLELMKIYPISRNDNGYYTICDVPLMARFGCRANNPDTVFFWEDITPMALSASLGYVAHLVEMISVIINRPLRNTIIHEGSHTLIRDTIKDIPSNTSRDFPLYSRSSIPTKAVKYAIYLLNQNIAQLSFELTHHRCDIRDTINNILSMFKAFLIIGQNKQEIQTCLGSYPQERLTIEEINNGTEIIISEAKSNHATIKNGKDYASSCLSQSHSSVDIDHMVPPTVHPHDLLQHNATTGFSLTSENLRLSTHLGSIQPLAVPQKCNEVLDSQHRVCRSDGCYTDSEDERDCHSNSLKGGFSNSDSNITLQNGRV